MIGYLKGTLLQKHPPSMIVDVHGVGYEIEAPMTTFYKIPGVGEQITLYTHLIIREDAQLLFGFATEQERRLFRTLIRVNGVGAKMALTILSGIEADQFAQCVRENNSDRLTRLPGVGKKTAERLIIEMRDRLDKLEINVITPGAEDHANVDLENPVSVAVSALISLGYKPQEASRYVHAVANENMDSENIIREALKSSVK